MSRVRRLFRFGVLAIISNVIACASDGTTTSQIQTVVNNIVVNLGLNHLVSGQTLQADAIARDAAGAALNGVSIVWSSSNPTVAKVTPAGLVTAAAPGQADIIATAGSVTAKASITVVASPVAPVAGVSVALSASTVLTGQPVEATATVRDSNNAVLADSPVSWSSSDPSVATIAASGLIMAIAPGTTTITATSQGVSGSATLTVQSGVASVTVRLIATTLSAGDSITALATVRDASNNILIDKSVAWSSSDVSIATVTPAGRVVAVTPGTATITATAEGQSGSAALTVASPVASVTVTLAAPTIAVGALTTATAVIKDANNNILTDRGIAWTSSNPSVVQVRPGGIVVGVSGGTANVIATVESASGSVPVTITTTAGGGGGGGGGSTQTPTQLAIATQPANVVSGVDIAPPMVVEVRDASNALVTTSAAIVTVSRASGTGTLAGALAVQAIGGKATFSDVRINGSGSHSLAFSATGLAGASSTTFTVTPAPATQLVITTQPPSTGQVAAAWSQQPAIQLRDATNTVVNQPGVVVTASIATGGGALGGTTTAMTNASGTATFTDLSISGAIGPRTLVFTGAGLTSLASSTINIAAGAPAQLAIATQPASSAASGVALARQPAIQLRDISNNAVNAAGVVVTASIATGNGTLGGTTTATTTASGLATFANLSLSGSGTFTLHFTAAGLTGATSNTIVVGAGAASKLSITQQPSSSAASGAAFAQQPIIQLRDASNNAVSQAGVIVTAAIATGGGTLGGIASATTDASGAATFTNLAISGTTGTRTLSFSAAGLTSVTSGSIALGAGAASQLSVSTQPSSAAQSGVAFAQQPIVQLRDGASNVVSQAGVVITVAIASGTGGTLGGTTTATTSSSGAATFAGLKISGSGAYTLRFTATGLAAVTSSSVTVSAGPAAALSITTQPSTSAVSGTVFARQPVIQLRDAANNAVSQAGIVVTASILTGGGTLGGTTTATTNASGAAAFSNLSITGTAGNRTLGFSAPSMTSVTSSAIAVSAGADTQAPTVTIASPASGASFGASSITVSGTASDNVGVTQVTWTTSGGGSGTATGTTSWTASGIALLSGSNVITVTAKDLANNTATATVTVTYAPLTPTKLTITTQPSPTATSGVPFSPQPSIQLRDASNTAVPQAGVSVTAAIASGGGTLGGTTSVTTDASGVATFTNLSITGTAGSRTISFTAPSLAGVTSNAVVVAAPGSTSAYFNSSEPGCNGSDPNVLFCDDFESGSWYTMDCDQANAAGGIDVKTRGWCGTIYNAAGLAGGTARCNGAGFRSSCAATTGVLSGSTTGNMADHALLNRQGVDEIWVRFYIKPLSGYQFGAEKMLTFNDGLPGGGGIKWGNLSWNCASAAQSTGNITMGFPVPMDVCQTQNMGNNIVIQSGNWYFYEVHYKLSSPGGSDGVFELWVDNCGPSGTSCPATPTLRMRRTNVQNSRTSTSQLIRVLWFEAWSTPVSLGERYWDQIKVSKAGPIGFMP